MIFDYIIIGGGIVGISTAWQLKQRFPEKDILLLEKESIYSMHQTGHNSGVIHAGVYYAPGSLKAKFCKTGVASTMAFCDQNDVPYDRCGKLLVATNELEMERMHVLFERCQQNEIDVELLGAKQLKSREPNIVGLGGIFVKESAIVDFQQVSVKMVDRFVEMGGDARLNHKVVDLSESTDDVAVVALYNGEKVTFKGRFLITCTGLMADRTTRMLGIPTDFRIIPFRGEYYQLAAKYNQVVNHLIYPIPDPDLPFLGVHLTRMIDGSVTVGPNAVLGWKREGYGKININLWDIWDMVTFGGFWRVLKSHIKTGLIETKDSLWKPGYIKLVQKYCPQLQLSDLKPYPPGIRAQAVLKDGSLVHDFLFAESPRSLHVCNAPSPAATSAIPIGGYICDKVLE
ncbi:MAG: L-2-hydroxyglutarate oxidase [Candidatus Scalindua sp.]|jgi:L-2-hydroxyglutarate oxidase|nr:L-2-hydroxyglutarate oxidase [Candidatus Scalindua sp.]MBT5304363.1 L-2-hydroxyglutarate oxidase [Candidatus Scalindua sp.]MBT6228158.1 L-2-hydroxyglutarate oxidase [Candidatus Scalindua sp.]MBT6562931.1 L-2-hydroxyglutarate oxidase [Candidatus Scalindua sp.]MBT7210617.1 L-2-hydroxyglutarate oxidase [Candidatus Scalindua sp.]